MSEYPTSAAHGEPLDYDDMEPDCPHCGNPMDWQDCGLCDDGYITNLHELDPLWWDEGDQERCEQCDGKSGWWVCTNTACKAK